MLSSAVLVAFGATSASAVPTPDNPPVPAGTLAAGTGGAVTVTVSGTWSWPTGSAPGQIPGSTTSKPCGPDFFGVGWGMVWNDPNDPGYPISYKHQGVTSPVVSVGTTAAADADRAIAYDTSNTCGTLTASTVTGSWSGSHTYASAASVPSSICVVTYRLRTRPGKGRKREYQVDTNRRNSYRRAVRAGNGATWATSPNCVDPASFKSSPTIVTTATNAQVGSAITDTAVLSGTGQDMTTPVTNAGGTITFKLYGPGDTTCASTPVFSSSPVTVNGDGTYPPVSYTPTQGPGSYLWIATYSGDTNNNGATELCGASGETSTLSAAPATSSSNKSTSPTSSVPIATEASAETAPVSGATTVHTGEPWAGSQPYVVALAAFGLSLMGLGLVERRRAAVRRRAQHAIVAKN